jgi:hypothetical protein
MDVPAALHADLAALSDALEGGTDLEALLEGLVDHARAAVESFLGMTVTVVAQGQKISFTVRDERDGREIVASLRIPLGADAGSAVGSALTLYAAVPGAFVDLAADMSYALSVPLEDLHLDAQLTAADGYAGIEGMATHSAINQAVGVLINDGHTPESAHALLRGLSEAHNISLAHAAARVTEAVADHPASDA